MCLKYSKRLQSPLPRCYGTGQVGQHMNPRIKISVRLLVDRKHRMQRIQPTETKETEKREKIMMRRVAMHLGDIHSQIA